MPTNTPQLTDYIFNPADYPPGHLDEPLTPDETAEIAKKTTNSLAVDRCRERGIPYSKDGKYIRYTRRDIYEYHRQHRRIPMNNP
jgi:hypothetical protein